MPKIIDHDQRRSEIVEVTKNLIIEGGFQAATMREIAAAAGYANGALKRYFAGKDEIIAATNTKLAAEIRERLDAAMADKTGFEAVTALCLGMLPDTTENKHLGKVLITFWERAINSPKLREGYREQMDPWRAALVNFLDEAKELGEIHSTRPSSEIADAIITFTAGAHIMYQLVDDESTAKLQADHMNRYLHALAGEEI